MGTLWLFISVISRTLQNFKQEPCVWLLGSVSKSESLHELNSVTSGIYSTSWKDNLDRRADYKNNTKNNFLLIKSVRFIQLVWLWELAKSWLKQYFTSHPLFLIYWQVTQAYATETFSHQKYHQAFKRNVLRHNWVPSSYSPAVHTLEWVML